MTEGKMKCLKKLNWKCWHWNVGFLAGGLVCEVWCSIIDGGDGGGGSDKRCVANSGVELRNYSFCFGICEIL